VNFRIAIHERKGSFSDRWIGYCIENNVPFEKVNCFDNNIIAKLEKFDALLWHWVFHVPGDVLAAKSLLQTLKSMGKTIFPDIATCWHYDNKIGQKYLLEAVSAPLVTTYVFYNLGEALSWIDRTTFPKVFKLRRGAGSANVRLVQNAAEARGLAKMAFGRGIKQSGGYFTDSRRKLIRVKYRGDYLGVLLRLPKAVLQAWRKMNEYSRERNYVYFQEFMPNNDFDTRITIIGNRAFGFTRNVRDGDFRASGSGRIDYDANRVDPRCVKIAFHVAKRIGGQSMAFDFVRDLGGSPKIVEISYCYDPDAVRGCPGHWDEQFNWHEGNTWPQDAILIDILHRLEMNK
jgi:glutathione synthase/RimK-type ligase-like ATP-grasp enzyme